MVEQSEVVLALPGVPSGGHTLEVAVDELRIALPLEAVAEVHRMVALHELPGAPDVVAGTVDVRGSVLAVLDLRRRLGRIPREPRIDDRLVRVTPSHSETSVLLWVDPACSLRHIDAHLVVPLNDGLTTSAHLAGVARTSDGLLYLYDIDAFLTDVEQADLEIAFAASPADT